MSKRRISQTEARRLRKRVQQLEGVLQAERRRWASQYPGGVNIGTFEVSADNAVYAAIFTAQQLEHAVVCVADGNRMFRVYALPHAKVPV